MCEQYYAHSLEGEPQKKWQKLEDHLKNTAESARNFAEVFNAGEWGDLAGMLHDIGKYSCEFQSKLESENNPADRNGANSRRVDHSTAGGREAVKLWPDVGKLLAYTITGHHGGMPDGKNSDRSDLESRLDHHRKIPEILTCIPKMFGDRRKPAIPFTAERGRIGFQMAFLIRMIFSCLVDADFLDTEKFIDPKRAALRKGYPDLGSLQKSLFDKLSTFKADSLINRKRLEVLQSCLAVAENRPGLFTLTVPTGGGKTLSSLAFALKHAIKHGRTRIIYVIPFTSIIEQNAAVFRNILGDRAVLEHHSNYMPEKEDEDVEDSSYLALRHRLACENWDAPLVVTTNVQFFESLFANRPSKCRKLHNIANSILILDEAQMLPEAYLRPCLEVIKELTRSYYCSVVLCTATQPAFTSSEAFPQGLPAEDVTEIIPDPVHLHEKLKRVRLHNAGSFSDDQMAERIAAQDQVLCIVNTRKRAADLYNLVRDLPGAFHLSARMCPVHRSEVLEEVREHLKNQKPCRVVSTQLVEAGVDVDFLEVYREMAGLDSIAQAAGRCNREGKQKSGKVFVFLPGDGRTPKLFRRSAGAAESVFRRFDDPFSPAAMTDYFSQVYWLAGSELDKKQILVDLEGGARAGDFSFRDVSEKFRLIETEMVSVIIPWDEKASQLIKRLEYAEFPGPILRHLQPYTVQIYDKELQKLKHNRALKMLQEKYPLLVSVKPYYSKYTGLSLDDFTLLPEDLIF